jgi:hypothetical protein
VAQLESAKRQLAEVSFARTLPREWVHRLAVAEVLLTDYARAGEATFLVGAQWPRRHGMYCADHLGRHDPSLLLESVRQAGILLATRCFDVPHDHSLVLKDLSCAIADWSGFEVGTTPADILLTVDLDERRFARNTLAGMRLSVQARRGGRLIAKASGAMSCLTPRAHARLRASHRPATNLSWQGEARAATAARVAPSRVGRELASDVLLNEPITHGETLVFDVRVDTTHPTLFDHPLDHLPGMLQLEAIRQATLYAATSGGGHGPRSIAAWSTSFLRYGDLDRSTQCKTRREHGSGGAEMRASLEQLGTTIAEATLLLR